MKAADMRNQTKFILLFIAGLLITMAAAGGAENAETLEQIITVSITALVGLGTMYLSTFYQGESL